jgi:hypothetical protein
MPIGRQGAVDRPVPGVQTAPGTADREGGVNVPYDRNRPRPTAYRGNGGIQARPIVLSSGRGCTKITPAEAVALARELLFAATGVEPGEGDDWVLRLAERVATQSEILQACAGRK